MRMLSSLLIFHVYRAYKQHFKLFLLYKRVLKNYFMTKTLRKIYFSKFLKSVCLLYKMLKAYKIYVA